MKTRSFRCIENIKFQNTCFIYITTTCSSASRKRCSHKTNLYSATVLAQDSEYNLHMKRINAMCIHISINFDPLKIHGFEKTNRKKNQAIDADCKVTLV